MKHSKKKMNSEKYKQIVAYKNDGKIPGGIHHKNNFMDLADKYTMDKDNRLLRNKKIVVQDFEREELFTNLHSKRNFYLMLYTRERIKNIIFRAK